MVCVDKCGCSYLVTKGSRKAGRAAVLNVIARKSATEIVLELVRMGMQRSFFSSSFAIRFRPPQECSNRRRIIESCNYVAVRTGGGQG